MRSKLSNGTVNVFITNHHGIISCYLFTNKPNLCKAIKLHTWCKVIQNILYTQNEYSLGQIVLENRTDAGLLVGLSLGWGRPQSIHRGSYGALVGTNSISLSTGSVGGIAGTGVNLF